MEAVGPELSLRRRAPITVGEARLSWSRLVSPFAAAAVVAALFLLRAPEGDDLANLAGLEELLHQVSDAEFALPTFLHRDAEVNRDMVLLALEEF
jgi:hypothetical protein